MASTLSRVMLTSYGLISDLVSICVTETTFLGTWTVFVFLNIKVVCLVVISIGVTSKYHSKANPWSIRILGSGLYDEWLRCGGLGCLFGVVKGFDELVYRLCGAAFEKQQG